MHTQLRKTVSLRDMLRYRKCPLQWAYARCLQPDWIGSEEAFRHAFHTATQCYALSRLRRRCVSLERLLQIFSHEIEGMQCPIRFPKGECLVTMMEDAKRMLKTLLSASPRGRVLAVEQPFRESLIEGLPVISGCIDLIEERKGVPWIAAWRAVWEVPSTFCIAELFLWALAAERLGWVERNRYRLEVRFLTRARPSGLIPVSIPLPPRLRSECKEELMQCWEGMKTEAIHPIAGAHCMECSYKSHCAQCADESTSAITLAAG